MTRKRRNHSPEFKAKMALDAAKGDKTVAELAQKYNLHANQISTVRACYLRTFLSNFGINFLEIG